MRTIEDAAGVAWQVETVSHGRTSRYLSAKVRRPILQFTCLDCNLPRRYAPFPQGRDPSLDSLSVSDLLGALRRARSY